MASAEANLDEANAERRLVSAALGECRLSRVEASPHSVSTNRIAPHSHDVDSIKLILQVEGRTAFAQNGVSLILGPRNWILYDPTRPYQLSNTSRVTQLLLQTPRAQFSSAVLARLTRPHLFDGQWDGLPRIVAGLMRSTINEAANLGAADLTRVGATLTQLATSLLAPPDDDDGGGYSASLDILRTRIKAYVDANLARGSLDVEEIAHRMGCSRRYVFRAFEADDTTPERYIWNRRLERSHERLSAEAERGCSISEIAFACGFSSSAHFSRAFRARYGVTPRDMRGR